MAINDIRLWHVTALWQRKDAHLKKEFIASAPTKEAAIKSAEGRLPINIRKADGYKTSARDLGTIKDNKIWFSSDVTSNAVIRIDDPLVTSELVDAFTILWGQEIGWRSTNQSATEKDKVILNRLKNDKNRRELLHQWADECLQFPETDPSDFFRTKLSEYLGADVKNIEDMIPVSDDEYDMIMSNARSKADKIINDARQSADDIRSQLAAETANLAKIAAALTGQMSWRNITSVEIQQNEQSVEPIVEEPIVKDEVSTKQVDETPTQIDNNEPTDDQIEDTTDTVLTTEEQKTETDAIEDIDEEIEEQIDSKEPIDENNTSYNDDDTDDKTSDDISETDETVSEEVTDETIDDTETIMDDESSSDDFFDDFPDEEDTYDDYTGDDYDDDPPEDAFHVYKDEDFEPDLEDILGPDENEPTEEEKHIAMTEEEAAAYFIAEQKAYEILLSFRSDILLRALADLKILTIDKRNKRKNFSPADKTLNEAYPITPNMSESDKVAHIVEFIRSCEDKDGMSPLTYVYNKYAIPEDDDEALE